MLAPQVLGSFSTTISLAQVTTGGVVSTTVIVCMQVSVFPAASVASQVLVIVFELPHLEWYHIEKYLDIDPLLTN